MGEFKDEHSGKGGSYVADSDGKRVLQERTGTAANELKQLEQPAPAKSGKSKVKGASNA